MLTAHQELLEKFGGHKAAGGLSVKTENFPLLAAQITKRCKEEISDTDLEKIITVDTQLFPEERDTQLLTQIQQFAPFGEGNPEPVFLFKDLLIHEKKTIGKGERSHLKLLAQFGTQTCTILFWGKGTEQAEITERISLIGTIQKDHFRGGWQIIGQERESSESLS